MAVALPAATRRCALARHAGDAMVRAGARCRGRLAARTPARPSARPAPSFAAGADLAGAVEPRRETAARQRWRLRTARRQRRPPVRRMPARGHHPSRRHDAGSAPRRRSRSAVAVVARRRRPCPDRAALASHAGRAAVRAGRPALPGPFQRRDGCAAPPARGVGQRAADAAGAPGGSRRARRGLAAASAAGRPSATARAAADTRGGGAAASRAGARRRAPHAAWRPRFPPARVRRLCGPSAAAGGRGLPATCRPPQCEWLRRCRPRHRGRGSRQAGTRRSRADCAAT